MASYIVNLITHFSFTLIKVLPFMSWFLWMTSYRLILHFNPQIDIDSLHTTFALKKCGQPEYLLSIEVKHLPNGTLLLTQTKYICDLLN